MDFELSEEQKLIQKTARDFARERLSPGVAERDAKAIFPYEQIKELGQLGFMGIMVSGKYGGAGLDAISYVIAIEEISKVDASVGAIVSVNNSLACVSLERFGNEEQKQKYLAPLASGEKLGAFSLTEAGAGSDAASISASAVLVGDHYVINGTKCFVTSGSTADVIILFATTDKTKGSKGISAFILEKDTPGFQVNKKENKLGIRGSDTCSFTLENCHIPIENRLAEEGMGFKVAMTALDSGRIGVAAQALGIAQASLEASIQYAKERVQFNRPIAEFQAIQFKLAEMETQINAARLLTYQAAAKKDRNEKYTHEAAMAKLYASEVAVKCAIQAVQIHGGYGYTKDFPVERFMRDAKITEIYEGTSEVQKIVIARTLLRR